MIKLFPEVSLPSGYEENTLFILVQSPRVLYVYWELSPAQRLALAEQGKLQLRLNTPGPGTCRCYDIDPSWSSFYFNGVDPGREYYCEIGVLNGDGQFYPLIYSNNVFTPPEKPSRWHEHAGGSSFWGAGGHRPGEVGWDAVSSDAYYK